MNPSKESVEEVMDFWRHVYEGGTRQAKWFAVAVELWSVAERLGRMPRTGDDGVEPRLISWVKNQRRTDLHVGQVATLNLIPGWTWAPYDDAWERRAAQVGQFVEREGRLPRSRAVDADERALGHWTARQRRAAEQGRMPYPRLVRWRAMTAERRVAFGSPR